MKSYSRFTVQHWQMCYTDEKKKVPAWCKDICYLSKDAGQRKVRWDNREVGGGVSSFHAKPLPKCSPLRQGSADNGQEILALPLILCNLISVTLPEEFTLKISMFCLAYIRAMSNTHFPLSSAPADHWCPDQMSCFNITTSCCMWFQKSCLS